MRMAKGDAGMVAREHWATPNADTRLRDARIYVLTSGASASAAEHFALAMKHSGRGTLVGAPTAGANHFGRGEDLGGGYGAFIPVGRTYDPATGKDWEGEGVVARHCGGARRRAGARAHRAGRRGAGGGEDALRRAYAKLADGAAQPRGAR